MKIAPRAYFGGEFCIPGDKSITHRAILFNSIAKGEAEITGALLGADCLSTIECMRTLGVRIRTDQTSVYVCGTEDLRDASCDCGNSGTTMRLLMGLLAGKQVRACLYGDASLSSRPMERVAAPLRLLGAKIATSGGKAPVKIEKAELRGCAVDTHVASAQVKSALILAALGAQGQTVIHEPLLSRDHTERMLTAMGADITVEGTTVTVRRSGLRACHVAVPSDISSAAYFMALGALLGETICRNVGVNPTRTGILRVFEQMGVDYSLENERTVCGEPVADIRVKKSALRGVRLTRELIPSLIDELPVIAVLCAFAEGESVVSGAEELRVKESDRIRTTVEMISAFGGDIAERPDGFLIRGKRKLRGGNIDSHLDHRIAMSGAVALAASELGGDIAHADCVDISFPRFYQNLNEGTGGVLHV